MLTPLLALLLSSLPVALPGVQEPDGSHTVGVVPPFHGEPAPPAWLRKVSHAAADPDCRHYVYEAYAGRDHWLVRYVMLPEGDEAFRDLEQVFLYPRSAKEDGPRKPRDPALRRDRRALRRALEGEVFRLVDRRDLMKE